MAPRSCARLLLALLVAAVSRPAKAAVVETVHANLYSPVAIRFAPDGRLFYLERSTGRVMVFPNATAQTAHVWAEIPVNEGGSRGLLGMAFHPSFPDSPFVYLYHTNPAPLFNRVVRLRDSLDTGVGYTVLLDGLPAGPNENGGRLAFGPDGMLYVTYGDQENAAAARTPGDVRGKLLRVTPMGLPAPGNPYGGGSPIYARGVRNVFGITFDSETGSGYFTDNGPDCDDELNVLTYAGDYGWGPDDPCDGVPQGTIEPLALLNPTVGITGLWMYRGAADPGWDGTMFVGAFNGGVVRQVRFGFNRRVLSVDPVAAVPDGVLDIIQGLDGHLWFSSMTAIYRLHPDPIATTAPPPAGASAWPNPSTGVVWVRWAGRLASGALDIVDLSGRRVRQIVPEHDMARWDGNDAFGRLAPAGVYLVRAAGDPGGPALRIVRVRR